MERIKIHLEIDKELLKESLGKMVQVNDAKYITLITNTILRDEDGDMVFMSPLLEAFMRNPDKVTMRDLVSNEDIERWMSGDYEQYREEN